MNSKQAADHVITMHLHHVVTVQNRSNHLNIPGWEYYHQSVKRTGWTPNLIQLKSSSAACSHAFVIFFSFQCY